MDRRNFIKSAVGSLVAGVAALKLLPIGKQKGGYIPTAETFELEDDGVLVPLSEGLISGGSTGFASASVPIWVGRQPWDGFESGTVDGNDNDLRFYADSEEILRISEVSGINFETPNQILHIKDGKSKHD
jgi:hypothetical protein